MAENEKVEQAAQAKKDKKSDKYAKPGFFARAAKWLKDMRSELKKVVWPSKEKVAKNTGTVILYSVIIGACIWIFDGVAALLIKTLLNVFGV